MLADKSRTCTRDGRWHSGRTGNGSDMLRRVICQQLIRHVSGNQHCLACAWAGGGETLEPISHLTKPPYTLRHALPDPCLRSFRAYVSIVHGETKAKKDGSPCNHRKISIDLVQVSERCYQTSVSWHRGHSHISMPDIANRLRRTAQGKLPDADEARPAAVGKLFALTILNPPFGASLPALARISRKQFWMRCADESSSFPLSHSLSPSHSSEIAAVVVVPIWSGSRVTDSEELIGSSSLLSRLPQYLITAMFEAHVAVATCTPLPPLFCFFVAGSVIATIHTSACKPGGTGRSRD